MTRTPPKRKGPWKIVASPRHTKLPSKTARRIDDLDQVDALLLLADGVLRRLGARPLSGKQRDVLKMAVGDLLGRLDAARNERPQYPDPALDGDS